MASIAIDLGMKMGVEALLRKLAPSRMKEQEALFGAGTGPTKMASLLESLKPILLALAAAGLSEALPTDTKLRGILELILKEEKAKPGWEEKGVLRAGGKTFIVSVIGEL